MKWDNIIYDNDELEKIWRLILSYSFVLLPRNSFELVLPFCSVDLLTKSGLFTHKINSMKKSG